MASLRRHNPEKKTTHIFLLERGGKGTGNPCSAHAGLESWAAPRAAPYRGDAATVSLRSASPRVQPAPLPLRRRRRHRRRCWLPARNRSRGRARAHGPRAPGGQEARHHWGTARRSSPPGSGVSAPGARDGGWRGAVLGPPWERRKGHRRLPQKLGLALERDEVEGIQASAGMRPLTLTAPGPRAVSWRIPGVDPATTVAGWMPITWI